MIFLGDIAHPFTTPPDFSALLAHVSAQPAVINLEGPIAYDADRLVETKLFNHVSVLQALEAIDTRIAVLANNHICDLPDGIARTRSELNRAGIQGTGAGQNLSEAGEPARIVADGQEIIVSAFGWATIQCQSASSRRPGVQPLETSLVLSRIRSLRREHPRASIIPVFHWNYELEPHPQPAHRRLAFAAIDAGADAVIAHHPHCVGGVEFHRGKLIAHSLGNWWMPQGVFFNGKLSFPEYTYPQVALEWHPGEAPVLHRFQYDPSRHALHFEKSFSLEPNNSSSVSAVYAGFSDKQYLAWFRKNRIKRKALPIYTDPHAYMTNAIFDRYVRWRHPAIMALKRLKGAL